jgi:hypothetical protein
VIASSTGTKGTAGLAAAILTTVALTACGTNLECDGHACVDNYKRDMALGGTVVRCPDGSWSHAGGLSDVCSGHRRKP